MVARKKRKENKEGPGQDIPTRTYSPVPYFLQLGPHLLPFNISQ
jgi:hypothetical protein